MSTIYSNTPEVREIALAAFPDYAGRKFAVREFFGPMRLDSYWEGGSRSYYVCLDLATKRHFSIQENGTPFSNGGQIMRISELPMNCAVVEHHIFQGRDHGITIHLRPENLTKMLPEKSSLLWLHRAVLVLTANKKPAYRMEYAQRLGISTSQWQIAKDELIHLGFLSKNGAITDSGRNQVADDREYDLAASKPANLAMETIMA